MPYTIIGTGHGPTLRYNVPELVGRYEGQVRRRSVCVLVCVVEVGLEGC